MIILYKGRRGAGKTLTMVKDALNFYNKGWDIYSNFDIAIPYKKISNDEIINLVDNEKVYDCVLLVDEIQLLMDSRRSMGKQNLDFSYFIQQIRKKGIVLLCTTQFTGTVDKRLREHTDVVVKPKIYRQYPIVEAQYFDLTSEEDLGYIESRIIIYNPQKLFNLYDTNQVLKGVKKEKDIKVKK